jgi:hypothetical protein
MAPPLSSAAGYVSVADDLFQRALERDKVRVVPIGGRPMLQGLDDGAGIAQIDRDVSSSVSASIFSARLRARPATSGFEPGGPSQAADHPVTQHERRARWSRRNGP